MLSLETRCFDTEFNFASSRSGGAGGQNVNKVSTKVELRFSIANSKILTDEEKTLLIQKLANKLTLEGELIIVSQVERSQLGNKERCIQKFYQIITKALTPVKKRIRTKPSRASKEKRISDKKAHSDKKDMRRKPLA
ncbi:MAG: alternative ribosome rescue aminoacyl-tRNA hydrolase ArfB [Tenuifilaceae bacterium]|jgi:ribosome-associated protein|nr:alternative ribosome rescue aminoacyl-tRNA hydrolase ArfB [Tenuifilaceae bacterium]